MTKSFDVVVIGTGTAASTVASRCRAAKWTVGVIDARPFGGTCALRGCDPKKILVGAAEVIDYLRQAAKGLLAAHAAGIVHRDIKPANLLLEGGHVERVKVLDFGLARRELRNEPLSLSADTLAGPGLVVGTPQYMAPEVLLGSRADARSDLWALGIVLHELCSGAVPFQGPSVVALCDATSTSHRPHCPSGSPPRCER